MKKKCILMLALISMLGTVACTGGNTDSSAVSGVNVGTNQSTDTKTTEQAVEEPVVTEQVTTEGTADWETPIDFEWNPHVFGATMRSIYGEEGEQDFYAMVDAVMAGEETFTYSNQQLVWNLDLLAAFLFPPYWVLVSEVASENGTATITYKVDAAERERILSEFETQITQLVEADVKKNDNETMTAAALYHGFCGRVTYDQEFVQDVSSYRAIMEYGGICQSFAGAYAYLCQQCGVDAVPIGGTNAELAHEWTLVNLDGKYYHMDPTFENGMGGYAFQYFGMTTQQREWDGYLIQDYNVLNEWWGDDVVATDDRFEPLWTPSMTTEVIRSEQGMEIVSEGWDGTITSFMIER